MASAGASAVSSYGFPSHTEQTAFTTQKPTWHKGGESGPILSSASMSPPSSASTPMARGAHLASQQYVEQHRAFVEHQRQLHDEERQLWHLEREELRQRIQELEQMVRQLGGQVTSAFQASENQMQHRGSSLSSYSSEHLSRMSSNTSTGDEFWRGTGGKSGVQATRAFPDPPGGTTSTASTSQHLPSIAETADASPRKKSVGFNMDHIGINGQDFYVHPIPTIKASHTRGSLDGITFKAAVLNSNGTNKGLSNSQSPSPMQSPPKEIIGNPMERVPSSEAREAKPQILDLPSSDLTASDLRVKDAGHTPLTRVAESSNPSSHGTPKLESSEEILGSREPRPIPRPPAERAESYFPEAGATYVPPLQDDVQNPEPADDPALKGPLALGTDPTSPESSGFLSELNSKLLEAKKENDALASVNSTSLHEPRTEQGNSHRAAEAHSTGSEEAEPKLKIKRSMNFGSIFGAARVGPGI